MSVWGRIFAAGYDHVMSAPEKATLRPHREALIARAAGEVLEIGPGYGASTGKTNRWSNKRWTAAVDLRAAKEFLRGRGAREIALVGSSMGGHAVLASSFEADIESVVAVSAPVAAVPEELTKKITGRKLFVCANRDQLGAAPNVLQCFTDAGTPKTLIFFGGREHSRAMFAASYGDEAVAAIVEFVCRRG